MGGGGWGGGGGQESGKYRGYSNLDLSKQAGPIYSTSNIQFKVLSSPLNSCIDHESLYTRW